MSNLKNQEINNLSDYIKTVSDQDLKVLLLKLKNELGKEDVTWDQIQEILGSVKNKDITVLKDIIPLII